MNLFRDKKYEFESKYLEELLEIREIMKRDYHFFPKSCCWDSAYFLNKVFGWEKIIGRIVFYKNLDHVWNYSSEHNLFIDITQDQFNPYSKEPIPKVVIADCRDKKYCTSPEMIKDFKIDYWYSSDMKKKLDERIEEYKYKRIAA